MKLIEPIATEMKSDMAGTDKKALTYSNWPINFILIDCMYCPYSLIIIIMIALASCLK